MYRWAAYLFVFVLILPIGFCGLFVGDRVGQMLADLYIERGFAEPSDTYAHLWGILRGVVEDCAGNRLEGVNVCLVGHCDVTRFEGQVYGIPTIPGTYLIHIDTLGAGEYSLRASKDGYETVQTQVHLNPPDKLEINFARNLCLTKIDR